MELVKRLEGSAHEEESNQFHFEEQYLHEEENNYIKKFFIGILGLTAIGAIGYFSMNPSKENPNQDLKKEPIAMTQSDNIIPSKEIKKEESTSPKKVLTTAPKSPTTQESIPTPIVIAKTKVEAPKKKEPVAVYTEILALEHKAETIEKKVVEKKVVEKKELLSSISSQISDIIKKEEKKKISKVKTVALVATPTVKQKEIKKATPKKVTPKYTKVVKKPTTIRIRKGDTLAILAKRYYGNPLAFQGIINANRSIKSYKSNLKLGQKVFIPLHGSTIKKKVVIKKVKPIKKTKIVKRTKTIKVKKGDTLALLAKRHYGDAMKFQQIIRANRSIKSEKSSLKLGQTVIIPYSSKKRTKKVQKKKRRYITVKKGYSLAYISKKFYGTTKEVRKIVRANYSIKNSKSTLRIGQKVYVPR